MLAIPAVAPGSRAIAEVTKNPCAVLRTCVALNKLGDTPGRLALALPQCVDNLKKLFASNFTEGTKKALVDTTQFRLLLAVKSKGRIFIFYRFVEPSGRENLAVYSKNPAGASSAIARS